MVSKEVMQRMVRFSSNYPLDLAKREKDRGFEVFDKRGQSKMGEVEPGEEGPQYLLGVISRALRVLEKEGEGKEDEEIFLGWLSYELALGRMGESEEVEDEEIKEFIGRWLEVGEKVIEMEEKVR